MNRAERRRQQKQARKTAKNTKSVPSARLSPRQQTPTIQNAIDQALQHHTAGRLPEAERIYRQILQADPRQPVALHFLGVIAHQVGKNEVAVDLIMKALAIRPNEAEAHNNLGAALKELGRLDEAVASYHKALEIQPGLAAAHSNLGVALLGQGKLDEAAASYQKALAIKPDYADALVNLCEVFEKTNRTDALRETVDKARQSFPEDPRFALNEAQLLKLDGDFGAARTVLEATGKGVADARFLGARTYLLGELCDRLGDSRAAYDYFMDSNSRSRNTPEAKRADGRAYRTRVDALAKRFTSDWTAGWRSLESNDGRPDPVFLVGFPRSGTTLLDTILSSHPAVTVVEEMPAVRNMRIAFERLPGGYPDGLAELDPAHLAALRQIYFTELDKHLEPEEQSAVVIDKLPLNAVDAGLIHRILPKARFLFVQRHPCDCVLSCFMQKFKINSAMANFLDLEDAADLYDKVMTLWRQYQTVLPLEIHSLRYESLVESFEETLTPIFDFLGVGWDDGVHAYTETAYRRGMINTPSYNQVTQPLYTRSSGRWERYREQMQPVLPRLLPWARRFGYDA